MIVDHRTVRGTAPPLHRDRRRAVIVVGAIAVDWAISGAAVPHRSAPTGRMSNERGTQLATGTVKFFNNEKGYGFISRSDGPDVFVHYSNIEGSGFRSLEAGQNVEFEIGPGRKGDEALNVRIV
jgi:CspA family cold shock protein